MSISLCIIIFVSVDTDNSFILVCIVCVESAAVLQSNRQHLSTDNCGTMRLEDYQKCTEDLFCALIQAVLGVKLGIKVYVYV